MAGGEPIPIVVKHLCQVFCDFLIVEDEAGISVRFDALVRPIMTAEHDPLAVHDNCFVVAGMLKAERLTGESHGHQYIQAFLFHEVAAYDANLASVIDLFLQGANKQTKFRKIFIRAPEIDVLILEPHALFGVADKFQDMFSIVVGHQERLNIHHAIDSFFGGKNCGGAAKAMAGSGSSA
jgi:hypothetical protein